MLGACGAWQESSVERFGAVHAKVKEGNSEQETTRGASLRELQLFLDEKDSKQSYAGLRRIGDDDGTAVWTILKKEEVAMQLEERAKEWRQEERRRDDLFNEQCAQVRAPSQMTDATSKPTDAMQVEAEAARAQAVVRCPFPRTPYINLCLLYQPLPQGPYPLFIWQTKLQEENDKISAEEARAAARDAASCPALIIADHSCVICNLQ